MNINSGMYSNFHSVSSNNAIRKSPVSFGHIYDYYDADEIKEARDNYGVFREPGEDSFSYSKRAREINDAWEENQRRHSEESKSSWWPF